MLDWTIQAADHYADIRADLKRRGEPIGANGLMIAAHARSLGAVIVTNNVREFGRVAGLAVENWIRCGRAYRRKRAYRQKRKSRFTKVSCPSKTVGKRCQ